MKRSRRALGLAGLLVLLILSACWLPPNLSGLESHPRPARSYAEALARWRGIEARDPSTLNPVCRSLRLDHGHRTANVLVLFHGLTNCPRQFQTFGERFQARGWNVLIARIPHHGLADRMTADLAKLNAVELARYTDEVIDIADGMGDRVTVVGLSLGGVMAAWAGQERLDVARTVAIAPMFGAAMVARPYTSLLTRALLWLPNRFVWWNQRAKLALPGPTQAYPRFSTRAVAETMRLGLKVERDAARRAPRAHELVLVSVERDVAINNASSNHIAELWKRRGGIVRSFEFPAALKLNHDVIDPDQVGARIDVVYPMLDQLIMGADEATPR